MLVLKTKKEISQDLESLNIVITDEQKKKLVEPLFKLYELSQNAYYEALNALRNEKIQ